MWRAVLPTRIEAGVALTSGGRVAAVGGHDGRMHGLCAANGARLWATTFRGPIKAAACCLARRDGGAIIGACFGGLLCALTETTGRRLWTERLGAPVFATPRADEIRRRLVVADLRGRVHCYAYDGGDGTFAAAPLWQFVTTPRAPPHAGCEPIFSTPALCAITGAVYFGATDGLLYALGVDGQLTWRFDAGGAIFAAPALATIDYERDGRLFVVYLTAQRGLGGAAVHCIDAARGARVWEVDAPVHGHSAPAVDTAAGQRDTCHGVEAAAYVARTVCVGGTDGSVHILGASDGARVAEVGLGAPVFSSLVVCASRVVVGCRDDALHCLELRADLE